MECVYFMRIWNNEKEIFKVGITGRPIRKRRSDISRFPYLRERHLRVDVYGIVEVVNRRNALDIERKLKSRFSRWMWWDNEFYEINRVEIDKAITEHGGYWTDREGERFDSESDLEIVDVCEHFKPRRVF